MNARTVSLALMLLTTTATSAFAQDGRGGFEHGPRSLPAAPAASQPAQAPEASPAPQARELRSWRGGDPARQGNIAGQPQHREQTREQPRDQPRVRELPGAEAPARGERPQDRNRGDGERRGWEQRPENQRDRGRPDNERRDPNWRVDRAPEPRPGVDGRDRGDHDRGDHDRDRPGDDRRWRNDGRRDPGGRVWEGDRRVRPDRPPVWRPHRYPPTYNAPSRYRGHAWRSPPGYYVRSWRFGEFLPYGWYEPNYRLVDWWAYGLPEPPYGYEWVRVGYDAVLVDTYNGQIVQVVRNLFW